MVSLLWNEPACNLVARNEIPEQLVVGVGHRPSGIGVGALSSLFTRLDLAIGLTSSAIIDPVQLDRLPRMIFEDDFGLSPLPDLGTLLKSVVGLHGKGGAFSIWPCGIQTDIDLAPRFSQLK